MGIQEDGEFDRPSLLLFTRFVDPPGRVKQIRVVRPQCDGRLAVARYLGEGHRILGGLENAGVVASDLRRSSERSEGLAGAPQAHQRRAEGDVHADGVAADCLRAAQRIDGCGVVTGPSMRFCGGDEPDCRAAIVSRRGEMTADAVRGGRADP